LGPERSGLRLKGGGRLSALFIASIFPVTAQAATGEAASPSPALNLAAPAPTDSTSPTAPTLATSDGAAPEEVTPTPPSNTPPLVITGYIDVGFAKAQGNGTSFPSNFALPAGAPADAPYDYYVDMFAPAVNSRGEAASTAIPAPPAPALPGSNVGGFFPRSAGIGGKPSFLLNTADVDLRYTAPEIPVLIFTRLQVIPRLYDADPTENRVGGESTRLLLEQAFGKIAPLPSAEFSLSIGKFDSVFGIEYLDNEANFRVGVTPSLLARYTTGQSLGAKVFYRYQLIPIFSAISVNAAVTNSGTFVEALQGPSRSLTGVPVLSVRVGYELNLARISVKIGGSAEYGPRNDQSYTSDAPQTLLGADARLVLPTFTLSGEYVHVAEEDAGAVTMMPVAKLAGTGPYPEINEFYAHGFWIQAAEELPLSIDLFRFTVYARYEQRHAHFPDFAGSTLLVDRTTFGVNVGIGESLQVKAEYLVNRELEGAPSVANNVFTSSAVWTW
jgi:hypothetical protein